MIVATARAHILALATFDRTVRRSRLAVVTTASAMYVMMYTQWRAGFASRSTSS